MIALPWGTRSPRDLRVIALAVEAGTVVLTPAKQAELVRLFADAKDTARTRRLADHVTRATTVRRRPGASA